jgi:hypothetical protein
MRLGFLTHKLDCNFCLQNLTTIHSRYSYAQQIDSANLSRLQKVEKLRSKAPLGSKRFNVSSPALNKDS